MKRILSIILFLPFVAVSQIQTGLTKYSDDTLPDRFYLKDSIIREHIYSGIPDKYKKDIYYKMSFLYADESAKDVANIMSSSFIYSDKVDLENYLNKILIKIIPSDLKNDSFIHVYILRDGNYNAVMSPAGQIFVNIGIFKYVDNEADIAAILAHELAHYYLKHHLNYYIANETGKFDYGFLAGTTDRISNHFSRSNELEADSIAIRWLNSSEYNIKAILDEFEIMERMEKNLLYRTENKWKLEENDHPSSGIRFSRLTNYYIRYEKDNKNKKYFLVDENQFNKYKEESKQEILKCLMNNYQYDDCIETAFKYHLYDPDNITYVRYLMEAIRRNCYLDKSMWKENFITNRYYDSIPSKSSTVAKKVKMKDHLFVKKNFMVLQMSKEEFDKINAAFYWSGEIKFTTNEEAFDFFNKLSIALNDHECYLSNALSYTQNKDLRNNLLKQYLSFNDIKNRKFAEKLLEDSIIQKLNKRKLLILDNVDINIRLGKDEVSLNTLNSENTDELSCILDSMNINQQNQCTMYLPKLKKYHMGKYRVLSELEFFSFLPLVSKGERVDLYILDPGLLDIFSRFGVNEIDFINVDYTEDRKPEKTIDAYKKVLDSGIKYILNGNEVTRYVDATISSLRIINDGLSKVAYKGESNKMENSRTGYNQLASEIIDQLDEHKKFTEKLDNYFKNHE